MQRPLTFQEFLEELEREHRRRQVLARPQPTRLEAPRPAGEIGPPPQEPPPLQGVSPLEAARNLATGIPAMVAGSFTREAMTTWAANMARLISPDVERRIQEKAQGGIPEWQAAKEVAEEGLNLPSARIPARPFVTALSPLAGAFVPKEARIQGGLQGLLEATTPVPFAGPVAAAAMPVVKPIARAGLRGVQAGVRAARPVVAEAAMRVGQPQAALRVLGKPRLAGAAAPDFLTVPGVDREIANLDRSIALAKRSGADLSTLQEARVGLVDYRENLLQATLPDEQLAELDRLRGRVDEIRAEIEALGETVPIKKPPKTAKHGLGLWSEARLRALAAHEGLDPYKFDWWDSIDSVVVKEVRAKGVAIPGRKAQLARELGVVQSDLRQLELGVPAVEPALVKPAIAETRQIGAIQPGMGIGERPAQGQLVPEYIGAGERVPLAAPEQLAARQARAAQVAAGQAEMPLELATPKGFVLDAILPFQKSLRFVNPTTGENIIRTNQPANVIRAAREALSKPRLTEPAAAEALGPAAKPALATKAVAEPAPRLPLPGVRRPTEPVTAAWESGAPRPFAFDPNSTVNQGRFRLLPPVPKGSYITRQSGTPGVSYIVGTKSNAVQSIRFNKAKFTEEQAGQWWEANKTRFGRGPAEPVIPQAAEPVTTAGIPPTKPPVPPVAEAAAPLPSDMPSSQKVFSRISFDQPRPGLVERLRHGWHEFNRAAFDDLHPIDEFVKAAQKGGPELSFEENPYIWARMLRGNTSKANVMLERGTFGKQYWKMEAGKAVPDFKGPGLEQILHPVREPTAWRDLSTYMTSKRAVELSGRNIKTGIASKDALAAIAELEAKHPDFPQIAERLYTYQNQLLDYGQEMGLLSKDLVAKLKTYKSYVPFQRVFEEIQARGFMGKKMANIASPIKRIKGSERPIVNPLESIVKNTYLIISASDRNQVGIMMANLAKDNPELVGLFRKIPTPTARVARVTAKELGISVEGLTPAESEAVFNIFRPSMISRENVVTVMVDGKRQFFQVDPDLYRGLLALDRDSMGMIGQLLSYPAKWLRAGATLSPDFMVRNPARDQMTAFVYSKYGFMPGVDWLRGTAHIFGKSDEFLLYKMSGAERSMLVSMDRQYLQHSFKEVVEGKGFTDYVKNPLDLLQIGSEFGEKGTRMGEFVKGIKSGATPLEAGFSSREVTLDFAKMGTTARAVNNITAFFNANIRGWDMLIRSFRNRPIHTSAMVFLGITVPSILLYAVNRDNPRYQEIPQWQKDLFWIVIVPDGPIIRIPKPFELGILFGSIPERFLEYLDHKDPEMLKETMRNAVEAGMPGILPTGILPVVENITNYSFFRQAPIVSATREEMPPALQYGRYTPEVLKKLGEWVNYSPSKIENILNGYTGGLGRYATDVLDAILKGTGIISTIPGPSPTLADMPVLKAFVVRDPYGSSSAAIDRFYTQLDEYERHERYLKEMLRLGEREKFDDYKAKHGDVQFSYDYEQNDYYSASARYFRGIARTLSEMRKKEQEVYDSTTLTPQEKRQKIDAINKGMMEIARAALTEYGIGKKSEPGAEPTGWTSKRLQELGQSQWEPVGAR